MADGRYTKYVTKNTGQLETMLKVILAPDVSLAFSKRFEEELMYRIHLRDSFRIIVY
jgi:hypothetical protein